MGQESRGVEELRAHRTRACVQRLVARRAVDERHVGIAVAIGRDVPHAVAEDAEIVDAVAVVVEQHRDVVGRAAEVVDLVDDAVARGRSIPDATAVDKEAGRGAGRRDVADQRQIPGRATKVIRVRDVAVVGGTRVPDPAAEQHRVVGAIAVDVG